MTAVRYQDVWYVHRRYLQLSVTQKTEVEKAVIMQSVQFAQFELRQLKLQAALIIRKEL